MFWKEMIGKKMALTVRCSGTQGLVTILAKKRRKNCAQNAPVPSLKSARRPLIAGVMLMTNKKMVIVQGKSANNGKWL